MSKVYFPGCGFGFWYLLGIFLKNKKIIEENNMIISGSSAGSIICFTSLLKPEYLNIEFLVSISEKVKNDLSCVYLNIYEYIHKYYQYSIPYFDYENLEAKLSRIRIQLTKVSFNFFMIPQFTKLIVTPRNLNHLKELVIASCQIPFYSRSKDHLIFRKVDNILAIDGSFIDILDNLYGNFKEDYDIHIKVDIKTILQIPKKEDCLKMFYRGIMELKNNIYKTIINYNNIVPKLNLILQNNQSFSNIIDNFKSPPINKIFLLQNQDLQNKDEDNQHTDQKN